jgi:hypothetical protein
MLFYVCPACNGRRSWPAHLPTTPACPLCDGLMQCAPAPPAPPGDEPLEVLAEDDGAPAWQVGD